MGETTLESSKPAPEFKPLLNTDEKIIHFQKSDLNQERDFEVSFVAFTNQRIFVTEREKTVKSIPIADLEEVVVDELYSSSRIRAKYKSGNVENVIYYSKQFVPEFAALTQLIQEHITGNTDAVIDKSEAASCSKCGAPLPERGGHCPLCVRRLAIFKRLLSLAAPYKNQLWILTGTTVLTVFSQMAPPLITKQIVDEVIVGQKSSMLNTYIALLLLSGLTLLVGRYFSGRLTSWIGGRLTADLRAHLHRLLQRLQLSYFQKRDSGEIVNRVMNDTAELQQFLVEGVPFFAINMLSFVVIAGILVYLNATLALLVFLPVPFLLGGGGWFWRKLTPLFHKNGARRGVLHSEINESISGIKIVKAFSQEKLRANKFEHSSENLFQTEYLVSRTFISFSELMFWIMSLGVCAVWFLASTKLLNNDPNLTLGTLLAFVGYIWLFYGPLQWFTAVMNWMSQAFTGAERIFSLLDSETEIYDDDDAVTLPQITGKIQFENAHFSYEKGKEIIKGISFEIKPGEMIGLVGKSGVGKSTIINLLNRFYKIDSGSLLIDNHPIEKIKLEQLRTSIGMVPQDTYLFNTSIFENIRYGKPDATFDEVVHAARAANAHEFILAKEDSYDTRVGEQGIMLSGGEKQRIAIARAILHDPPILILDEATSSVDSETEKAIQEAIKELTRNRTTIAIAHRLATLRHANRLIVIDNGKIVEMGTHDELIELDGHFAKLVKTQSEINKLRSESNVWEG